MEGAALNGVLHLGIQQKNYSTVMHLTSSQFLSMKHVVGKCSKDEHAWLRALAKGYCHSKSANTTLFLLVSNLWLH
jgi:hypothetical protein